LEEEERKRLEEEAQLDRLAKEERERLEEEERLRKEAEEEAARAAAYDPLDDEKVSFSYLV